MSYSNPTAVTYRLLAKTLSSATISGYFIGPAGKSGRLVSVTTLVTTEVTTTPNTIDVGTTADPDAYGTHTTALGVANTGNNNLTYGATNIIAADTVHEVSTNGECAAGAADIEVVVEWY